MSVGRATEMETLLMFGTRTGSRPSHAGVEHLQLVNRIAARFAKPISFATRGGYTWRRKYPRVYQEIGGEFDPNRFALSPPGICCRQRALV